MTDPLQIRLKADLTKSAEDITEMAKDTHKGFGKILYAVYGPWIEKRIGETKRIEAQANRDAAEIKDGFSKYDIATRSMISLSEVSSIDALCVELESVNSTLKAKRLAAALMTASIKMKRVPEDEVADEPLNQTFFNRWRAEAELIDDENLRQWWAHLLVEETKKPNSISPRTLDVAKNLAKDEALLFQRLLKGCFGDLILPAADADAIFGSYYDTTLLNDAGLLQVRSGLTLTWQHQDDTNGKQILLPFIDANAVIIIETEKIHIIGNPLTRAGIELRDAIKIKRTVNDIITIADKIHLHSERMLKIIVCEIQDNIFAPDGTIKNYNWSSNPIWEKQLPNNI